MSGSCQSCSRSSPNAFICSTCQAELKSMLIHLGSGWKLDNDHCTYQSESWIEMLEDAALGRTRLGESARRSTERNTPLPVNLRASAMLDDVRCTLSTWVRHICEARGIEVPV